MDALIVFIVLVLCPLAVFLGIAQIKKAKGSTGGSEMRASELRALIERAVADATSGLSARIADLEERLGDEPVHAIRERLGANPASGDRTGAEAPAARLDTPAMTAAFDPDADLDDVDGRPVARRARA